MGSLYLFNYVKNYNRRETNKMYRISVSGTQWGVLLSVESNSKIVTGVMFHCHVCTLNKLIG